MYGAGWVVIPGSPSHGVPKAIDTYLDSAAWLQSFVGVLQYQHLTARWFLDDLRAKPSYPKYIVIGLFGSKLEFVVCFWFHNISVEFGRGTIIRQYWANYTHYA